MTEDEYLHQILSRETVSTGLISPALAVQSILEPSIKRWANEYLVSISPSGSFAKGTANKSGTDIDLFISISQRCTDTLGSIYDGLATFMSREGYDVRRQNVSVNVKVDGCDVDLVPGKRQDAYSEDHSLWRRKAATWTKTNVSSHIAHVKRAGRTNEIRIIKLWRNQKQLDFPSFYLELSVIEALRASSPGTLGRNVMKVFHYLKDAFPSARIVDPANTNNIISDDLTNSERATIQQAAVAAVSTHYWEEVVK